LKRKSDVLQLKPVRRDLRWETSEDGCIVLIVPKFRSKVGKRFCRLLGKKETFSAHLDKIGSLVWKECNGDKTVGEILEALKKELPNEKDLDKRLVYFIYKMRDLGYLSI
jgi:hypothetical protein